MANYMLLLILKIAYCIAWSYKDSVTPTIGAPWPMPQKYVSTMDMFVLDSSNFNFVATGETCDILELAFARYLRIIFRQSSATLRYHPKRENALSVAEVKVQMACEKFPNLDMDESYDLRVDASSITLHANSVWGALRGLETFSQIVVKKGTQFYVNGTTIIDYPRFKYRGMLIDTSRHFLSVSLIKQHLEAMAQNKFNVLHWHITDDPSFPFVSTTFPEMSQMGAFPAEGHTYPPADVIDIIDFARVRGIRVIPEFDTPGHTQSWGYGIPNLLTKCYSKGVFNGNYGPVDPTMSTTYNFLEEFFGEVANVFPDHYIHVGGDEVDFSCWRSNPNITDFMMKMNFSMDYSKLEQYYMQNLLDIIGKKLSKGYLIWQEVIDNGAVVQPDTVVEIWKQGYTEELDKVTKLGYQTLLAACWYLNAHDYKNDWMKFYTCDPHHFNGTTEQKKLVIGGEACMWTVDVDNTNFIPRFWPRASAVGERLWSHESVNNSNLAISRIEEHRCRMVSRGFAAEPLNGVGFCPQEYSTSTSVTDIYDGP